MKDVDGDQRERAEAEPRAIGTDGVRRPQPSNRHLSAPVGCRQQEHAIEILLHFNRRVATAGRQRDVSDADSYISQTYNEKGVIQKGYFVPFSLSRIFTATPRRLTLHARTSFTECCPNLEFGGWTEVRTATVTIRKR